MTRPDVLAYNRAEADLRRAHPDEFARYLRQRRIELGLPAEAKGSRIDLDAVLISRAWDRGETLENIAAALGVHPNTIRSRVRELGLAKRPSGWNVARLAAS